MCKCTGICEKPIGNCLPYRYKIALLAKDGEGRAHLPSDLKEHLRTNPINPLVDKNREKMPEIDRKKLPLRFAILAAPDVHHMARVVRRSTPSFRPLNK